MNVRERVSCELAGPAVDAAAHLLAHVPVSEAAAPLVRAGSLFDRRYVAWCTEALDDEVLEPVARDAILLGALLDRAPEGILLQALLVLFRDPASLRSSAALDLGSVRSVEAPWAVDALRSLARGHEELVEVARCALGLVAPAYASLWDERLAPALVRARDEVQRALDEAAVAVPSLADARVLLSHPLGPRGRAFPGMILVGAPADWCGIDAARCAAIAAHEHAVRVADELVAEAVGELVDPGAPGAPAAPTSDAAIVGPEGVIVEERHWAVIEHLALEAMSRRLRSGRVGAAHRDHVASLDRRGLDERGAALVARLVERLGG